MSYPTRSQIEKSKMKRVSKKPGTRMSGGAMSKMNIKPGKWAGPTMDRNRGKKSNNLPSAAAEFGSMLFVIEFGKNTPKRRARQTAKLYRTMAAWPGREGGTSNRYGKPGFGWNPKLNRPIITGMPADGIRSYRKKMGKALLKYYRKGK